MPSERALMRVRIAVIGVVLGAWLLFSDGGVVAAGFRLPVRLGPIAGSSSQNQVVSLNQAALVQRRLYDVQDDDEHLVRGLSLAELLRKVKPPKSADTVIFEFENGMRLKAALRDKRSVASIFVAFTHGSDLGRFDRVYRLHPRGQINCPKVVYSRKVSGFTAWRYTSRVSALRLVSWSAYQAQVAQPTRQKPRGRGWKLYARHCQSCHGFGGRGASYGPDFISGIAAAYRRVPPLKATDKSRHPSLHEKVRGAVKGRMPSLAHISNTDIGALWRWLHKVYRGATK